jgi:3-phosphoglycerate kinase
MNKIINLFIFSSQHNYLRTENTKQWCNGSLKYLKFNNINMQLIENARFNAKDVKKSSNSSTKLQSSIVQLWQSLLNN